MSFCSFTKDFSKNSITTVSNSFIIDYMTDASGDAVKVYLYGLFLCENFSDDVNVESFSKSLCLDVETVCDCFKFWEEYGIVSIISTEPFTVKYLSTSQNGKPRKFKPEKYTEFNKAIQVMLPDRMISTAEYSEYFSIMENYQIKPEAMLMIVKYCVDIKGSNVGFRYISTVAHDFANRQLKTVESIEKELSDYITRSNEIERILQAIGNKRKPEIEDLKYFNKWHSEMQFELESILFSAKKCKIKNMEKLDALMTEFYTNKRFAISEIENYLNEKTAIRETAMKVAKALSVYCEVISTYVDNYVSPWLSKGYDVDTLVKIASYCFKTNRKSFEEMNDFIDFLYSRGLVSLESIVIYFNNVSKNDEFIKKLLSTACTSRKPNRWDRENLEHWREWGFSDEMLLKAAERSSGKNNPIAYMNIVLSNWKSSNVFTIDKITQLSTAKTDLSFSAPQFGNEHNYTKEDFENLFDNLDDIDL